MWRRPFSKLRADSYHLVATYRGNADFAGSASGTKRITVAK